MRKEADHWRFSVEGESAQVSLARLLIALEELRVRLNPQAYPNLEVSDEGHLWFNVPSAMGMWEVFILPEGFGDLPGPALALSFPHRPAELKRDILEILVQSAPPDATVFAACNTVPEILAAYAEDRLPPLRLLRGKEGILAVYKQVEFFAYCGLHLPVADLTVLDAENLLREMLTRLEEV